MEPTHKITEPDIGISQLIFYCILYTVKKAAFPALFLVFFVKLMALAKALLKQWQVGLIAFAMGF
jgi:hypothetical protein